MTTPVVVLLWASLLGAVAGGDQVRGTQEGARQRAPESFSCDRNNLTSYTGVVTTYRRQTGSTSLTIRTDYDTTEAVSLKHPGTDDPSRFFRMQGEPFAAADWTRIETRKGVLRDGTRASAWVCADGRVMVDWGVPSETRGRQR
jgi:hypothetical protein